MKLAIYGYGNLGRGVEAAAAACPDLELVGIFTRRDPAAVHPLFESTRVFPAAEVLSHSGEIDVLVICGGSATDLPAMTPELAAHFNVVDSFDTHAAIPEHFAAVEAAAKAGGHLALISAGWDPGLFSLARAYATAILPNAQAYTFWGRGVSQGHSDAIRRIEGVRDARQYTVPIDSALEAVRAGQNPRLTARDKHLRECYVVLEEGADAHRVEQEIKTMPNYFADYDTTVTFVTQQELDRDHAGIPHGGRVICTGRTGTELEHGDVIEYSLKLDSNPEFTAAVLAACARAVAKMHRRGTTGCITVLDVAPADLSPRSGAELRRDLL